MKTDKQKKSDNIRKDISKFIGKDTCHGHATGFTGRYQRTGGYRHG